MTFAYTAILSISSLYMTIAFFMHCIEYDRKISALAKCKALAHQLDGTKSAELRKWATRLGLKWRNVHGKNRHLKVNELRGAIFHELTASN